MNVRRAALKLAALAEKDRNWILSKLAPRETLRIAAPLSLALKLPASDLQNVLRGSGHVQSKAGGLTKPKDSRDSADIEVIRSANLAKVAEVLDQLDPVSLALLLDSQDWPWLSVYLNRKVPRTRKALGDTLQSVKGKGTQRLSALILQKVAQQLRPTPLQQTTQSRFEELLRTASSASGHGASHTVGAHAKREPMA